MGMRLIDPGWRDIPPFWARLDAKGHRVIVADVPYTFLGHLPHGLEVVDWGTHGQTHPTRASRPDGEALLRRHGHSPIRREAPIPKSPARLEAERARLVESAAAKTHLLLDLMRLRPWDLFLGVYAETHRAGHMLFTDEDASTTPAGETAFLSVYRAIDRELGRLTAALAAEGATIVVFSVHGMTRDRSQPTLVDQAMERLNEIFVTRECGMAPALRPRGGLVRALRRRVPPSLQLALAERAPDGLRRWVVDRQVTGGLDWSRTPGFPLRTDIGSDIRLNLVGRETQGFLEPGGPRHRAYVTWMEEVFRSLEDAERGTRLVEALVPVEAVRDGPVSGALPDFIVEWRDVPAARRVRSGHIGEMTLPSRSPRGGDHTVDGFVILDRPELPAGLARPKRIDELDRFLEGLLASPAS